MAERWLKQFKKQIFERWAEYATAQKEAMRRVHGLMAKLTGIPKKLIFKEWKRIVQLIKIEREQERLKALGERRDECNQMLEGVLAKRVAPLDTDIKALKEALGEVDALAAMDGPGEVKEALVTELRAWLETVEGAWAERLQRVILGLLERRGIGKSI